MVYDVHSTGTDVFQVGHFTPKELQWEYEKQQRMMSDTKVNNNNNNNVQHIIMMYTVNHAGEKHSWMNRP